ncbi:SdrD B-like domain-containing protein, partial [Devosia sp.]|uniref:SdrD B-like domain-containing protein n=1 Tax=Devosia sp. TaxID=1871048 RepID=UPI0026385D8B
MAGFLAKADMASAQSMSVGNLIFVDANGNGHADSGEGVEGVMVELWKVSGDPEFPYDLQDTTLSGLNGFYSFQDLTPGTYKVTVPASEFAAGKPLQGMYCLPTAQLVGDDDTGAKGQYDFSPELNGISTLDFIAAPSTVENNVFIPGFGPVGSEESGFMGDYDDSDDTNGDMTVDLGFYRPLGIGNLVFVDTNHDGKADPGEGIAGVDVQLYRASDTPGQDFALLDLVTDDSGHFLFGGLLAGDYKLYIPPSQFQQGGPLEGALSVPGVGTVGQDDDVGEHGIDDPEPQTFGILSQTITLVAGGAPTEANGETGSNAADDDTVDADVDLTVDLGFVLPAGKVGVGNLVFIDNDHNGKYDDGEGVAGVTVKLFAAGANPLSDTPVAFIRTASDGSYLFSNIDPGDYFLFVPPAEFALGKPLFSALSVTGTQSGDDESGEDGIDVPTPENTGVATAVFTLALGTAPTDGTTELGYAAGSDNFHDADVDLTHDFGFVIRSMNPMSVGNLVFIDIDHNGHFDTGEGAGGVLAQLFREGDDVDTATPVASQLTQSDGNYFFTGLVPGNYFVHIAASSFGVGQPLE